MSPATSFSTSSLTSTTTFSASQSRPSSRSATPRRGLRKSSHATSTPNLNSAYHYSTDSHPPLPPKLPASASTIGRKTSLAGLTSSASLARVSDATQFYTHDPALTGSPTRSNMVPSTPGKPSGEGVVLGDTVDVPGGMIGTVRFVGTVAGKKGTFAGVELHHEFLGKGKNSGDVEGVSYFTTSVPGAGIFLPVNKAVRRESGGGSIMNSFPMTPTPGNPNGLKAATQNSTNYTPPTPGLPKFSASVGAGVGARAPSPSGKKPRTSLPRPDSPVRRSVATPVPRPSIGGPAKTPSKVGSPTNKFSQSVRGTAGDPSKRPGKLDRMPSTGPRSASALGFDDETAAGPGGLQRSATNGSIGSLSSLKANARPASRANIASDQEVDRLRTQLADRDRQLKDQAMTLADMESSLTELQMLINNPDGPGVGANGLHDKDATQLRTMLREKNEKIAMLTAEFDAHRADFRSTIDTLEMASTETERVYEKRMEELIVDLRELESRNLDVDSVASQLKQLEELVQELEEGLEDARRGEAEARGEVEFLRGEVERTRTELRSLREKNGVTSPRSSKPERNSASKELESKEDEIRGLKAIIHSLSRDSIPSAETRRMSMGQRGSNALFSSEALDNKIARDNLERQVLELQGMLDKRSSKQEELERELDNLRRTSLGKANGTHGANGANGQRSSLRDSRDTVILTSATSPRSPEQNFSRRHDKLDASFDNDSHSVNTENSTLWCEICETGGHDILTCTNMFGSEAASDPKVNGSAKPATETGPAENSNHLGLKPSKPNGDAHPAPLSPLKRTVSPAPPPPSKIMPNPMESGPVAGKESGIMDPEKWCAVCERDGHDSVDCPFEDAF